MAYCGIATYSVKGIDGDAGVWTGTEDAQDVSLAQEAYVAILNYRAVNGSGFTPCGETVELYVVPGIGSAHVCRMEHYGVAHETYGHWFAKREGMRRAVCELHKCHEGIILSAHGERKQQQGYDEC